MRWGASPAGSIGLSGKVARLTTTAGAVSLSALGRREPDRHTMNGAAGVEAPVYPTRISAISVTYAQLPTANKSIYLGVRYHVPVLFIRRSSFHIRAGAVARCSLTKSIMLYRGTF